jgi:predicted transposase YdaD
MKGLPQLVYDGRIEKRGKRIAGIEGEERGREKGREGREEGKRGVKCKQHCQTIKQFRNQYQQQKDNKCISTSSLVVVGKDG